MEKSELEARIKKLENEIHELKRTRSEAEARAQVAGYKDGQRDMRALIRGILGENL